MQKVLIIEDDCNTRSGLQELLQLEGFEVQAVADGVSARMTNDSDVDIIIADYRLPDTNGIQIIQELATNSTSANTILMTACLTSDIIQQAKNAGIHSWLSKPLDIDQLLSVMHTPAIINDRTAVLPKGKLQIV